MGMSYRRAWLLIDELNHIFEEPVIDAKHGGSGGGGAELTPFGHRVVQRYRAIDLDHWQPPTGRCNRVAFSCVSFLLNP